MGELQRPVGVAADHERSRVPFRAVFRNSGPSDASMCSAGRWLSKLARTTDSCPELAAWPVSDVIQAFLTTGEPRSRP